MAKFEVWLYYHGCLEREVEAESKEEALEKVRSYSASLDDKQFLEEIEVYEDGHDVSEISK